jgi:cAMP phosphodiesterase
MVLDELSEFDGTISKMCYGNYTNGGKEAWVASSMKNYLVTKKKCTEFYIIHAHNVFLKYMFIYWGCEIISFH